MADTISYRFRLRRRLAAAWTALNEILLDSEIGLASDTRELKVGDGATAWNTLPFLEKGMQLSRLGDVDASAKADGLGLVWSSAAGKHVYSSVGAGGAGGSSIVAEAIVTGSAVTSLTVDGLDLAADRVYLVQIVADNATAGTISMSLYASGDNTPTNYYVQTHSANNGTLSGGRVNASNMTSLVANEGCTLSGFLALDVDGKPRLTYAVARDGVSSLVSVNGAWARNVVGNVTSLTLTAGAANGLAVGTTLRVLHAGSGGQTAAVVDPDRRSEYFDDFLQTNEWSVDGSGAGAGVATVDRTGHDGVVNLSGGTTATGFSRISHGSTTSTVVPRVKLTSDKLIMEACIATTQVAPNATDNYTYDVGLRRAFDTGSLVSASIRYDATAGAARWGIVTRNNAGSSTVTVGTNVPAAQTWHRIRLEMTATEIKLFVNDVLEVTETTTSTFPDSGMSPYAQFLKVAGVEVRGADIDWYWLHRSFAAPRQSAWP